MTEPSSPPSPRIIALMNQKGGVGKTTTAVNLGAAIARGRDRRRVLLIDLDPQAHLTLHLGLEPGAIDKSVYHLLVESQTPATEAMQTVAVAGGGSLAVLPSEVNLAGAESELADRVAMGAAQTILRTKVRPVLDQFDVVLIDCPPSLGLLTINALTLATEVIVPMQAHFLALQGLSKLLETVQLVREAMNPSLRVSGVVLCMHEGQTILAGEVIHDLRAFLAGSREAGQPWSEAVLFEPPVRRNIKLAESPSFGKSIFDYAADCRGAADYHALARAVMSYDPEQVRRAHAEGRQPQVVAAAARPADAEDDDAEDQPVAFTPAPLRIDDEPDEAELALMQLAEASRQLREARRPVASRHEAPTLRLADAAPYAMSA